MQLGRTVPMPLENDQQTTNYRASQSVGGAAEFEAIVRSLMGKNHALMLGEVMAVEQGVSSTAAVGFLSVRPMVFMVDGSNNTYDRAIINKVPFFRMQSGSSAIIMNPQVGDIGLMAYCERDISMVKRNKKQAAPNSRRQFNINDAIYLGGFLNKAPTQFLQFKGSTMEAVTPSLTTSANLAVGTGATGSFSTNTGQTVTVSNGIIIGIV